MHMTRLMNTRVRRFTSGRCCSARVGQPKWASCCSSHGMHPLTNIASLLHSHRKHFRENKKRQTQLGKVERGVSKSLPFVGICQKLWWASRMGCSHRVHGCPVAGDYAPRLLVIQIVTLGIALPLSIYCIPIMLYTLPQVSQT